MISKFKKILNTSGKDIKHKFFTGNRFITSQKDFDSAIKYNASYGTEGLKGKSE